MPPSSATIVLPSPAELAYLHSSLSLSPPIRPDGRTPTQFRTLVAELDVLPSANGSARVCFADGSEAIVGIKAEVQKSSEGVFGVGASEDVDDDDDAGAGAGEGRIGGARKTENSWIEMSLDVPGYREDDALPVFLASMLTEPLLSGGALKERLWISRRHHWKLYIDVSMTDVIKKTANLSGVATITASFISTSAAFIHDSPGLAFCPAPTTNIRSR
jgi:exosome complex component RRP42